MSRARQGALGVFLIMVVLFAGIAGSYEAARHAAGVTQRQGQLIERKLCVTLVGLAALRPPAGNPEANPSRAYLQQEHARLAQLGTDIGCPVNSGSQEAGSRKT